MGTIFLVLVSIGPCCPGNGLCLFRGPKGYAELGGPKAYAELRGPNARILKVSIGRENPTSDTRVIHLDYSLEQL